MLLRTPSYTQYNIDQNANLYNHPMPGSRRSGSLTRDAIVEEALQLIQTEGVTGLTMRAVASALGVTPMAAYYHVADKDELLRLVVERVSASTPPLHRKPGEYC